MASVKMIFDKYLTSRIENDDPFGDENDYQYEHLVVVVDESKKYPFIVKF
jgi:hypothetical protein